MGDAASHIIFDNVMLYMMFFCTDFFGISAGFVGTMFLLARALDAISDPCTGLQADRTRSRWGYQYLVVRPVAHHPVCIIVSGPIKRLYWTGKSQW